jgi:hypothetical protein
MPKIQASEIGLFEKALLSEDFLKMSRAAQALFVQIALRADNNGLCDAIKVMQTMNTFARLKSIDPALINALLELCFVGMIDYTPGFPNADEDIILVGVPIFDQTRMTTNQPKKDKRCNDAAAHVFNKNHILGAIPAHVSRGAESLFSALHERG